MKKKLEYKNISGVECLSLKSLIEYYDLDLDDLYFDNERCYIIDKNGNAWAD